MKGTVRKLINSKFYTKLVGSFLVILLVSTIFIITSSTLSFLNSRDQYRHQLQEGLDASASVVGSQLMMAFRLGSTLFQEYSTIMFYKPEASQTVDSLSEVHRVQELIQKDENGFTPLIHSIFTYYPSDATVLTSSGRYDKDFYFTSINSYENYDQTFWDTNFTSARRRVLLPQTNLLTRSGKITVFPVVTVSRLSGQMVVHVCNIATDYITKLLSIHGVVGNAPLILDNQNNVVYGQIDQFPQDFLQGSPIPSSHILLSSTNEETGLVFHELVSKAWINQMLSKTYYPSVALVLLLLVGGSLLVLFFSLRIYRPIGEMKSLMQFGVGDGKFDELNTIRTEMEELLDKEDRHQQQELVFQLEFARHAVHLLLHGIQPKELAKTVSILETQRGFIYSHYVCCSVLIEFLPSFYQEHTPSQQAQFRSSIPSLLRSFTLDRIPALVVALEEDFYELIFNIDTADGKVLVMQLLQEQLETITQESGSYCLSFGIGKPVESISALASSHNQALAALQIRESSQVFQIVDFERLPPKKKVAFSFYDQKGIANNLEMGNKEVLGTYILNLIERNEQRCIDAENMAELYRQIVLVGQRSLEEHGHQVTDIERFLPLYTTLAGKMSSKDLVNLKDELCRLFLDIQQCIHVPVIQIQKGCIQEVKNYLDLHYQMPLSLDIVADQCNLSAKYLSHLFKDETGENFSDYLVRLRVEKAKQMLTQSNAKIGEISHLVGIESRATFLRIFKKVEGITPMEYRKLSEYKRNQGDHT